MSTSSTERLPEITKKRSLFLFLRNRNESNSGYINYSFYKHIEPILDLILLSDTAN